MKKLLSFLLILIFLSVSVNAIDQPLSVTLTKSTYSAGDTLQAEVILMFNPVSDLTASNFLLKDSEGTKIPILIYMEKLSSKHYFIYFNLPSNLEGGTHSFVVDNYKYVDGVLKQISEGTNFEIDSLNKGYSKLINAQDQGGSIGSEVTTTALTAIAFKSAGYTTEANNALTWLVNNQDPTGCYPSGSCNIKDTSFALLALDEFSQDIIKTRNWLVDASNSFDIGTWTLNIESSKSESGTCTVNTQEVTITNGKGTYTPTQFPITLDCSTLTGIITTYFDHSYLGSLHEDLFTYQGNQLTLPLETSGCYGINYKEACDYESTGYAIYALEQIGENPTKTYLATSSDASTKEQALNYLNTKDSYSYNWLLNNRQQKAWSTKPSYQSESNDIYTTALVALALEEGSYYSDAKSWISSQSYSTNIETAISLYVLFMDEKIPVSFSVNPAVLVASSTNKQFTITLENNYISPISISLEQNPLLSYSTSSINLVDTSTFDVTINTNTNETSTLLVLNYNLTTYSIPILFEAQYNPEEIPSTLIPIPSNAIKILKGGEVINSIESDVSPSIPIYQLFTIKNIHTIPLHNLTFELTGNLNELITLDLISFATLDASEELELLIRSVEGFTTKTYSGSLTISSQEGTLTSLPISIRVTPTATSSELVTQEATTVNETTSPFATREGPTGEGYTPQEKEGGGWKWAITIIVIALIGGTFFAFKFKVFGKKKKKQTFEGFVKSVEKRKVE